MKKGLFCLLLLSLIACDKEPFQRDQTDQKEDIIDFGVPHNEIWYTTSDYKIITPTFAPSQKPKIISNTYSGTKGVMVFESEVTQVEACLFMHHYNLTSVTLPSSVTKIGEEAFIACDKLHTANIPSSVESIGKTAFGSSGLSSITIPNKITILEESVFSNCKLLTTVILPNNLTKICKKAFANSPKLRTITIPDSVEEVEPQSFAGCYGLNSFYGKFASADGRCLIANNTLIAVAPAGLKSFVIPNGVTSISDYTFAVCHDIEEIIIPDGVTTIGNRVFVNCSNLREVTIPESVTTIGEGCFINTGTSQTIYCKPKTPPMPCVGKYGDWEGFSRFATIYVPMESVELYKNTEHWSKYADNIVGYEF